VAEQCGFLCIVFTLLISAICSNLDQPKGRKYLASTKVMAIFWSVYRSLGVNTVVKVCYECAMEINYNFREVSVF